MRSPPPSWSSRGWDDSWDEVWEAIAYAETYDPVEPPPAQDPEITISAGAGVTEGTAASFTLTANPAPSAPLTVKVNVTAAGSFGVTTGTRNVTVPTSGTFTFTVPTTGDQVDEADGSVTATVKLGTGYTVGSASAASVNVADDDDPPPATPEITISGGSGITEGGTASFTITASPAPASPITVNIGVTEDGSWGAAGAATVTVSGPTTTYTITTSDDQTDEADGSVTATVKLGTGYTVGAVSAATVSVADDDDPPPGNTLTVSIADPEESAARAEFLKFTVSASEAAQQDVTISYTLSPIRLAPRLDYCIIASGEQPEDDFNCSDLPRDHDSNGGEVTIAAGEDNATIFIWIDRRALVSAGSQIYIFLKEVEGAKEITQGNAYGRVTE
ncbi:MAG: hypothetical protein OXJ55_12500 [Caldilineaceae bacterium]|nr:hypothetical protein [Caldilineaceae bacterium]